MDHPSAYSTPELEDLLKKLDEQDATGTDNHFHLLDDVRFSDLRKMNDANLAGRLVYYEREFTFEMNPRNRREYHREVVRTKVEQRRRVLEKRRDAIAAVAEEMKAAA